MSRMGLGGAQFAARCLSFRSQLKLSGLFCSRNFLHVHKISTIPLPFFRSVATVVVAREWERNCWKRLSLYMGMKWPERWLAVHLRQNGKNRTRPYCYGTAVTAQRRVATATAQRNISRISNVILTALTQFLRNLPNGNGKTATEERQRNGGNQALETNCAFCDHFVVDARGLRGIIRCSWAGLQLGFLVDLTELIWSW